MVTFQNVETAGQSIQSITVADVTAVDVLQAELIAERSVNRYAQNRGLVNSTTRWEKVSRNGDTYTIKFS